MTYKSVGAMDRLKLIELEEQRDRAESELSKWYIQIEIDKLTEGSECSINTEDGKN